VSDSAARDEADDDRVVRILLVEDVLPLLELQKSYLKRTTCRVLTARTGSQALKLCRRDPPDLVFLDAAMPDIDGLAACRFLKADPLAGRVPVVLIASPERREECARAGCDGVLIKPFDSSILKEIEKAIMASNLGITPGNDGKVIRLVMPPLTEERRKQLVHHVKELCEQQRISLRNLRRDVLKKAETAKKEHGMTEDEHKKFDKQISDLLKEEEKKIDDAFKKKEAEVLAI